MARIKNEYTFIPEGEGVGTEERACCESLIQTALSDLEIAEDLMKTGKYGGVVFFMPRWPVKSRECLGRRTRRRLSRRHRADIALYTHFKNGGENAPKKSSRPWKS